MGLPKIWVTPNADPTKPPNIVVDSSNRPIDCPTCPCGGTQSGGSGSMSGSGFSLPGGFCVPPCTDSSVFDTIYNATCIAGTGMLAGWIGFNFPMLWQPAQQMWISAGTQLYNFALPTPGLPSVGYPTLTVGPSECGSTTTTFGANETFGAGVAGAVLDPVFGDDGFCGSTFPDQCDGSVPADWAPTMPCQRRTGIGCYTIASLQCVSASCDSGHPHIGGGFALGIQIGCDSIDVGPSSPQGGWCALVRSCQVADWTFVMGCHPLSTCYPANDPNNPCPTILTLNSTPTCFCNSGDTFTWTITPG